MITVITGPPCAGKSTYARKRARRGDLIIDFDAIAAALGSPDSHDHDPRLREIAAAAWSAAVDRALSGGMRAWIIDSRPGRQRQRDYGHAGARIVALGASREELHRRADADGRSAACHARIDTFLADAPVEQRTAW